MPAKLPAPSAGTCEHAAPKGSVSAMGALLLSMGAELLDMEPESEPDSLPDALPESDPEPHAARPRARVTATGRTAPRVRVLLFTGGAPCSVRATAGTSMSRGEGVRPDRRGTAGTASPAGRPSTSSGRSAGVRRRGQRTVTRSECQPLAPSGKGLARSCVCSRPRGSEEHTSELQSRQYLV